MIEVKNKVVLILSLIFTLFLFGFVSACNYCGDGAINQLTEECDWGTSNGLLCWAGYGTSCNYCTSTCELKTITNYCGDGIKQECEECDDGNVLDGDGCSSICELEEEPTCTHDVAVRYSYLNSFGTGIAVGYGNGTWINGNPANLSQGTYQIKYFIDNKKEADDNVHITVKIDNNNLIPEYNYEIDAYHSKEIAFNTAQLCGLHTISVNVTSDGDECNLEDNYAERQIYIDCFIEPPVPVCGNNISEAGEQCDDGNLVNGDGCSSTCQLEQNPPQNPICGNNISETGEQCDDGNLVNGDGCSSICKIENPPEPPCETPCKECIHTTEIDWTQFCEPNWQCYSWSECYNGISTRKCRDVNNCDFSYNKPSETMACEQNALVWKETGNNNTLLWIMIGTSLVLLSSLVFLLKKR